MESKLTSGNDRIILDVNTGKPFSDPREKGKCWQIISSKMKLIAVLLAALAAFSATFFENVEKIVNFFKEEQVASVPFIVMKLSNSSSKNEVVYGRGDFFLWLPGPEVSHTSGKYEFLSTDGKSLTQVTVHPKETITVAAKIMNEKFFSKMLFQGECELSFILRREKQPMMFTQEIPFTESAIKKYYVQADIGK